MARFMMFTDVSISSLKQQESRFVVTEGIKKPIFFSEVVTNKKRPLRTIPRGQRITTTVDQMKLTHNAPYWAHSK